MFNLTLKAQNIVSLFKVVIIKFGVLLKIKVLSDIRNK